MTEYELSNKIIGSAIEIHKALGPGLLESAYKECLNYKLMQQGLKVDRERPMPLIFENTTLDCGYRLDLLVENKVVIEIKSNVVMTRAQTRCGDEAPRPEGKNKKRGRTFRSPSRGSPQEDQSAIN
jgi:GxxExxY protein